MSGRAVLLRRLQRFCIGLLVAWVLVHTVIVWTTGMSAWRLGALGMYSEPEVYMRSASIVACVTKDCEAERRDVQNFAPVRNLVVPLLSPAGDPGSGLYQLVRISPLRGALAHAHLLFRRFPSSGHARGLVRAELADPCGPYLVVLYVQHASMLSREAKVGTRPFVVSFPLKGCTTAGRLAGARA